MPSTPTTALLFLLVAGVLPAQASGQVPAPSAGKAEPVSFERAAADLQQQLDQVLSELAALNARIAAEKVPLGRRLDELEAERQAVRADYQQRTKVLDSRALDLNNLRSEIKWRGEQNDYLANMLVEYVRNLESRLHIAELDRYREPLQAAKLAHEHTGLEPAKMHAAQVAILDVALGRLEDALGGSRFDGTAVDPTGLVSHGTFVLVGPAALFRSADGTHVGTAEQRLGSLEPAAIAFADPKLAAGAGQLVANGAGEFPLDPTLGNAHKIEATHETWLEHVQKGGNVMVPIFALAGLALLVALYKWVRLSFVRKPGRKRVAALLAAVRGRDAAAARQCAAAVRGPAGRMLTVGVEHLGEPRELLEEVMYETVLTTRLQLQRMLPFIGITAGAAPLLGLLGTVTGIMETFKLITVFGTGDVKTLSSGISEALITTEYGLYVAIPALLLHALLSRKVRGIVDEMEKAAIAFANEASKAAAEPIGQVA